MNRLDFDEAMNGVFAAFQKPAPRQAVLDEIFKPVADLEDEFIVWAAGKLKAEEKLPNNVGRELSRMYRVWIAETTPVEQWDPHRNEQEGDKNCPDCKGTGWHYVWYKKKWYGSPYAIPCACNTKVDLWENPPKKATIEDLKRCGFWTMRQPPVVRDREPTPLGFSLKQMLDRLRAGQGIVDEPEDPRRKLPEGY